MEFIGVQLVDVLASHHPDFLSSNPDIVQHLHLTWTSTTFSHRFNYASVIDVSRLSEPLKLINCLMIHAKSRPSDLEPIIQLLVAFSNRDLSSAYMIRQYLFDQVPKLPLADRRQLFSSAVTKLNERELTDQLKSSLIDKVLLPSLLHVSNNGNEAEQVLSVGSDNSFVHLLLTWINKSGELEDRLKVSILQLLSVLITCVAKSSSKVNDALIEDSTRIIQFTWERVLLGRRGWSNDDLTVKGAGLLFASFVVEFIPTQTISDALILDLYTSTMLFRCSEHRNLLSRAANLLQVQINTRFGSLPSQAQWAKVLSRTFDSAALGQTQHLINLVVTNANALAPFKNQLYAWIFAQINRLAQQQPRGSDYISIAIDLAEVVVNWDREDVGISGGDASSASQASTESPDAPKDLQQYRETLAILLFKIASQASPTNPSALSNQITQKCLKLLSSTFNEKRWEPIIHYLSSWFEKLFTQSATSPQPSSVQSIKVALKVLQMMVSANETWLSRINQITPSLCNISICIEPTISAAFRELIGFLLKKYPVQMVAKNNSHPLWQLYNRFHMQFTSALGSSDQTDISVVHTLLHLFVVLWEHQESYAEPFVAGLMKILLKLQDTVPADVVAALPIGVPPAPAPSTQPGAPPAAPRSAATLVPAIAASTNAQILPMVPVTGADSSVDKSLLLSIRVLASFAGVLDLSSRKQLLAAINFFLEKTTSSTSIMAIIGVASRWISNVDERHVVAAKDKALLLQTIMACCFRSFQKTATVMNAFYDLVKQVFTMPEYNNSELTQRLEAAFMTALRHNSIAIRESFFTIYSKPVENQTPFARLDYCFNESCQKWDTSSTAFWIKQCLDLLLSGANCGTVLSCSDSSSSIKVSAKLLESTSLLSCNLQGYHASLLQFVSNNSSVSSSPVLKALRTLGTHSSELVETLWDSIFHDYWKILSDSEKSALEASLLSLFQQEYLEDQGLVRPNAVKTLFISLISVSPAIVVSPELVLHLAKTHNSWHCCAEYIRSFILRVQTDRSVEPGTVELYKEALLKLYSSLNEDGLSSHT
jgi:hypothetical protein